MDKSMELRKLPPAIVFKLGQILDGGNGWKHVMAIIPKDPSSANSETKYSAEHIRLIETAGEKQNKSCSEILLDEWGTSGRLRPNLNLLLQLLIKAELFRAVEYVSVELLKEQPPARPSEGPAAVVDLSLPPPVTDNGFQAGSNWNISHVPFSLLETLTGHFDETPLRRLTDDDGTTCYVGHKLGTGAFGTVFYGQMNDKRKIAVKKLSLDAVNLTRQFENEIRTLSEYQHKNLVPLVGFSCDTPHYCLIYEFMENGSLLDRLQVKGKKGKSLENNTNLLLSGLASSYVPVLDEPLPWLRRIDVAIDTSRGIHFLHTARSSPLIHRDIKTANILLDQHLVAKLGDFGLVRVKPNRSESKLLTSTVFGTSAYMAPEAFRGDVSVKMDVFSLGVVLLELLTGLPPYDENREGCDLVTYVEDVVEDSIQFLLEEDAGDWDVPLAQQIYEISLNCLEEKRKRPVIEEVLKRLESLRGNVSFV